MCAHRTKPHVSLTPNSGQETIPCSLLLGPCMAVSGQADKAQLQVSSALPHSDNPLLYQKALTRLLHICQVRGDVQVRNSAPERSLNYCSSILKLSHKHHFSIHWFLPSRDGITSVLQDEHNNVAYPLC